MAAKRKEMNGTAASGGVNTPKVISALKDEEKVFEGGFFSVRSPLRKKQEQQNDQQPAAKFSLDEED